MTKQKWYNSNQKKYVKIILLTFGIIAIFIGGKFIYLFSTILGAYSVVYFKSNGIEIKNFQAKYFRYKYSDTDLFMAQIMSLLIGTLFFISGLVMLFSK